MKNSVAKTKIKISLPLPTWYEPKSCKTFANDRNFLGRGGFGEVLLCFNQNIGPCVVKCLPTTLPNMTKEDACQRFTEEAGIILLANHENIVNVYGITQWRGYFGLIMKYMEMGNLTNMLKLAVSKRYQIPFDVILRINLHVAAGLTFLHNIRNEEEVVHGDLKPLNVLIDENLTAKLGDFGGSCLKTFTRSAYPQASRDSGRRENTSLYTAPERLQDINMSPTKASDVYSFSMIIYETLTDHYPYENSPNDLTLIEHNIIRDVKPTLERLEPKKSSATEEMLVIVNLLESTMKDCWQLAPNARPDIGTVRKKILLHYHTLNKEAFQQHVADTIAQLKHYGPPLPINEQTVTLESLNQHIYPSFSEDVTPRPTSQETEASMWEEAQQALHSRDRNELMRILSQIQDETAEVALIEQVKRNLQQTGHLEDGELDALICSLEQGGYYDAATNADGLSTAKGLNELYTLLLQKNFDRTKLAGLTKCTFTICSSILDPKKKGEQLLKTAELMKQAITECHSKSNACVFFPIAESIYENLKSSGSYSNIECLEKANCFNVLATCFEKLGKAKLKSESQKMLRKLFPQ
uniref:receptor-interacting serine/threonine-protein kinase 1-like isoform X2 n=1 Tax=Ciona intestinalis TaxID=7719 RepID=UPI000EF51FF9|nr:receptor-interacting serine/threonine-protein kinase 1-like isoform X2 [Ciona intestinalis]|eukprot:XP_026690034.1 receptor-interacting serine/threonine-protein kinase 1-like isoform X2 [Ciona intestinalis]